MNYNQCFPVDYSDSRQRFTDAAKRAGATVNRYSLSAADASLDTDDLSIDVASVGQADDLLVVSSGLHGVEGFFGAAVQLALLDRWQTSAAACRLLLIHAMNPWGYKNLRRVDEQNIDLNRNFPNASYRGAPRGYQQLNALLNPARVVRITDFFTLRAGLNIARHGMSTLKEAVATGQYEYPKGLFFGGNHSVCATTLLCEQFEDWLLDSKRIFHVDIHTGLGRYAQCKVLVPQADDGTISQWCAANFSTDVFEQHGGDGDTTAYPVKGMLGDWLLSTFHQRPYYFVGAEVGTYPALQVLKAMRLENAQHFYGQHNSAAFARSKQVLLEHFCPQDHHWRQQSMEAVIQVVEQVMQSMTGLAK